MVYALLVERADAADAVSLPTLIASGKVKPEAVDGVRERHQVDDWLAAAMGAQAEADQALLRELRG